jgi:menaquinone-dependent protoporphyrinogen IX oxidase
VTTLKNLIHELTTNELVSFTMIYSSIDALSAISKDEKFEEKLDFFLTKHLENMNAEEFAAVCNSLSKVDSINQMSM